MHTTLKRRTEDTVEKPSAVISEVLSNVFQITLGSLTDASATLKTIKRKRFKRPISEFCRFSKVRVQNLLF